jgi:hypothetical protein
MVTQVNPLFANGGIPPIEFVALAQHQNSTTATTLVINKPTGVQEGDLMVAVMATDSSVTWTGDTSWTEVSDTGNRTGLRIAWKRAGASEGASYTFTSSSSRRLSGVILAYRNATFGTMGTVQDYSTAPSGNIMVAPSITVADPGSRLLAAYANRISSTTYTTPSGMTSRAVDANATAPSWHVFDQEVGAGASGTRSSTASDAKDSACVLFALRNFKPKNILVTLTSFSGTSTSHTFRSDTQFAAIVFAQRAEVSGTWPATTCTVNGVSATERVYARFSSGYTEGTRTYTIANPTSGTVAFADTGGGTVAGYIFEFDAMPTYAGSYGTSDGSIAGSSRTTFVSYYPDAVPDSVIVHGAVIGRGSSDLVTNFTGDGFARVPTTASTTYYASAAGYSLHAVTEEWPEHTWTVSPTNTHYFYLTAIRLDF